MNKKEKTRTKGWRLGPGQKVIAAIVISVSFLVCGCDLLKKTEVVLIEYFKNYDGTTPSFYGTILNDSKHDIWLVKIILTAYNQSGGIIEQKVAYPDRYSTIPAGAEDTFDTYFMNFKKWEDVTKLTYKISCSAGLLSDWESDEIEIN